MLCAEPEERLFFRGIWYEGLYPRAGASREDREELSRFEREMLRFAALQGREGAPRLRPPPPPLLRRRRVDRARPDLDARVADARAASRARASSGSPSTPRRDDFGSSLDDTSAWAGIHYFASRLRGASPDGPFEEPAAVPDLARGERPPREAPREGRRRPDRDRRRRLRRRPEGRRRHAPLARRPAERGRRGDGAARRLRAAALHGREGPRAVAREPARLPALLRVRAVARRQPDALRAARRPRLPPLLGQRPLRLARPRLRRRDAPDGDRGHGPTVLTYYLVFAGEEPRKAREKLLSATWSELAQAVLADLSRAHPDLPVPRDERRRLPLGPRDGAPAPRLRLAPRPRRAREARRPRPLRPRRRLRASRSSRRRRTPASAPPRRSSPRTGSGSRSLLG